MFERNSSSSLAYSLGDLLWSTWTPGWRTESLAPGVAVCGVDHRAVDVGSGHSHPEWREGSSLGQSDHRGSRAGREEDSGGQFSLDRRLMESGG